MPSGYNETEEGKEKMPVTSIESFEEENTEMETAKWSRKIEYILSMVGYCVGLGNIWRFPYICMRNGGGAFLIPFVFFLITCGLPLFFLEVALGQFLGQGPIKAWEICPLFRGIGLGMVILIANIGLYYNVLVAWILYYICNSFFNPLPFMECGNAWNTENCVSDRSQIHKGSPYAVDFNYTLNFNNSFSVTSEQMMILKGLTTSNETATIPNTSVLMTSEEEFWENNVLQKSTGLEDIGTIPWHLSVCFLAAWIVVYFCIMKGVKSVGKKAMAAWQQSTKSAPVSHHRQQFIEVVYVTATLPYILLTVLLIRGITLPGGIDGIIYYLKPDFEKLLQKQVWLEAALQVFYSLGPGWGGLITLSSYNKFSNNCLRDAVCLTLLCEGTSLYGGLAVFSILGYMSHKTGISIGKVVTSGPGLGFIAYPEAIAHLPLPNLWAVLFFIMLLTVALDSQFVHMEVVISAITGSFPVSRKHQTLFTAFICVVFFLIGLSMCSQGGIFIFQLVDWYVGALGLISFVILESFIFGWIYGIERFSKDVELMLGRPIPLFIRICICFITPVVLMIVFVFTLATYKPPNYGSYHYPDFAQVIGWIFASISIIPLFVYIVIELRRAEGRSTFEKLKAAVRPSYLWRPNNDKYRNTYEYKDTENRPSLVKLLKTKFTG